jgi:chitinase
VRIRSLAIVLAVSAVLVSGVAFSGAVFAAVSANIGNLFGTSNAFNLSATMVDPGANLRGTVSLQATASDGGDGSSIVSVKIQRSPAGAGTWTDVCTDTTSPYSCSFDTTAVADGLYDFRAIVTNNAGGSDTSASVNNRRVDNTAPTAGITDPGTPLRGTITLDASGTDGGSGVANVTIQRSPAGAGTWTNVCVDTTSPYSCSFDTTAVADGLYDVRAVTTDNAGNTTNSTLVTNRRIDNTAPTAGMTDPGTPLAGTVTLSATGTDGGSGVASVKIQRSPAGAGTWTDVCTDTTSPYSCSFDTTAVADGLYDLRAVSTDNAGNTTNSTVVANRRVDNTAPTATMTDPGTPLSGTITLGATGTDGGSGVANVRIQRSPAGAGTWIDVCTDTTSPYSCSFDTTIVADGLYDFRSITTDNASNSTTSTAVTNRRIDNTAPTATMNDPGAYLRGTVSLTAAGTDAGSGVANVTIQRSPAGAGTWTAVCTDTTSPYSCSFDTTAVADGLYDLRAITTDNAGNTTTSTTVTNRRVDNTAPTATMNDPGANLRGTVSLTAAGTDAGSGVANVTIQRSPAGAGTWTDVCTDASSPYSCSFDTTAVADGLYDLRAITTDNAGNTTTSTTVANRRVDNTAPAVTMTDPGANIRGTVTLGATSSDTGSGVLNVVIQRSPAGAGTWTDVCTDASSPYSCSFDTTTVTDGLYDFRAVSTDVAGNTANNVVTNRRVDNTAPTATMNDPGAYLRGTVSLTAAGTDAGSGVANVTIQRWRRHLDGRLHRHDVSLQLLLRHDCGRRRALRPPRHHDRQRRQHDDLDRRHQPAHRQHRSDRDDDRSGHPAPRHDHPRRDGHGCGLRRPQRRHPALARRRRHLDGRVHRHDLALLVLVRHDDGRRRALRLPRDHDRQRRQHDDLDRRHQPAHRQHGADGQPHRSGYAPPRHGHAQRDRHGRGFRRPERRHPALPGRRRHLDDHLHGHDLALQLLVGHDGCGRWPVRPALGHDGQRRQHDELDGRYEPARR